MVSGAFGLTKVGAGALTLSGNNTYSGGTTITSGPNTQTSAAIVVGSNTALGTGAVTLNNTAGMTALFNTGGSRAISNNISLSGTAGITTRFLATNATSLQLDGVVSGGTATSTFLVDTTQGGGSTGFVKLTNAGNTFAGTVQLFRGGLAITSDGALGNAANSVFINIGTSTQIGLRFDAAMSSARSISLGGTAGRQVLDTNGNNVTLSGIVSGTGQLFKAGGGTLQLSNANTYTGGTTISAGTLRIDNTNALGTSGTIQFGTGAPGTGGILQYGSGITTDLSSRFSNAAGQDFNIDTNGNNVTYTNQIKGTAGTGNLTKLGTGTLTLSSGLSRYTGVTTISGGTLSVSTLANGGADSSIGTSTNAATNLVFDGGDLTYTGANVVTDRAFTINADKTATITTTNNLTMAGATGPATNGSLTKAGIGTLTLTGDNTYTGATNITAGTLAVNGSTAAGSTVNVGTAGTLSGSGTINGNATLTGNGVINKSAGSIGGTLSVTGGNWNGAGSVSGIVTSSSGTFTIGSGANLTANSGLHVTGGSLAAASATSTITGDVNYTSSANSNFAGVIAGSGKTLTMNNTASTLTLGGTNTYTGDTNITAGTLAVNGSTAAGSTVNVGTAGTLSGIGNDQRKCNAHRKWCDQ